MKINKKYFVLLISALFVLLVSLIVNFKSIGKTPELIGISKNVANPGDIITIYGNYFGGEISRGRVYINDKMIYQDFIKSWDNKEVSIILQDDFESGMIKVTNMFGESKPYLITSFKDVPLINEKNLNINNAYIESGEYINGSNLEIKLEGHSFGQYKNQSQLKIISDNMEYEIDELYISQWSDTYIIFYLPYKESNLTVSINTHHGTSNKFNIVNNDEAAVTYSFSDPVKYSLVQIVDIINVISLNESIVKLYMPVVYSGLNQNSRVILDNINLYNKVSNTVDFNVAANFTGYETTLNLNTEIEVSSIEANIKNNLVGRNYSVDSPDYKLGFQATPNVEESKDLKDTAVWLVRNNLNRFSQSKIIMDWLLQYVAITTDGSDNATVGFANRAVSNRGMVNLVVSMLRSIGIPSRVISGIKEDDEWVNYKWVEFYLPDGGWIPMDVLRIKNDPNYEIGLLENNRICFTKGVTVLEYEKTKFDNDFYALQNTTSNYEGNIEQYSAIWHNVIVK